MRHWPANVESRYWTNRFSLSICLLCFLTIASRDTFGQEIANIRNDLESDTPKWVGEKVAFHVDLMSASFFSGTAHFDLPEIPGVILMKEKGSPTVTSESVGDDTWSVQRHRFMAYAHRAGPIEIPAFNARFSVSEGFGKPAKLQRLKTSPMKFESKLPPGAEGYSLLVSTSELKATETWSVRPDGKKPVELMVGDAITRNITMEASDLPAMALPKIPFAEIDGLQLYSNAPELDDREYRGTLTGKRTESVTYVCERPGEHEFPAMILTWWDTESKSLKKESFPAVKLVVKPDPNASNEKNEDAAMVENGYSAGQVITLAIVLLSTVFVVYRGWRFLDSRVIQDSAARRKVTEPRLFANVLEACRENNASQTYQALMSWMERLIDGPNSPTLKAFLNRFGGSSEMAQQFELLQQALMGMPEPWSGERLADILKKVRKQEIKASFKLPQALARRQTLPSLNPESK